MASEGLNKVMLIGNLGVDPELKHTPNGGSVLRIRLATTEKYLSKAGERSEKTEWHTVIIWGNRAEALSKILAKGRTIYVEGRLQTRQWEDKEGGKRSTTEITASQILLLGGGAGSRRSDDDFSPSSQGRGPEAEEFAPSGNDFSDDDIPF